MRADRGRRLVAGIVAPLVAGGALVGGVVWLTGAGAIVGTLGRLGGLEVATLVAAAFASSLFTALALRVILARYGHVVSAWLLFRLTILAFAVGWLVPSGYVAGFPVAAWVLKRRGIPFGRGLASFVIERFFELGGYALLLPTVLLSGLPRGGALVAGVLAPLAGVVAIVLDLALGLRLARRTLAALAPRVPALVAPAVTRGAEFLGTVSGFFDARPGVLCAAVGLSFLSIATGFVRAVLTATFLRLPLAVPQIALLVGFSLLLLAMPFFPGAIGVYEGGMIGFFRLLDRPASEGVAFAMVVHGVELVVAATGVLFLVQLGSSLPTARDLGVAARA
jgi:uncharacterized membrane protein YbhN (UPF0104 family)